VDAEKAQAPASQWSPWWAANKERRKMEKAISSGTPRSQVFIQVSPLQLREIADRLEQMSRSSLPGEQVSYDFTRSISLCFDPEVSSDRYLRIQEFAESRPALIEDDSGQMHSM
jgi:hypothetical protein